MEPPTINISPIIRFLLYLVASVALLTVSYVVDKDWAGDAEVQYVTGLAGLLFILAAAKTGVGNVVTTVRGLVQSETGETGTLNATVSSTPVPDEGTDADTDDGLDYEQAGGKPYPRDESGRVNSVVAVLMAVLLSFTGMILTSSPSSAYISSIPRINIGGTVLFDGAVVFDRQADGTGVYVDWFGVTTTGCSNLRSTSPARWYDIHAFIYDGNSGELVSVKDFPNTNTCSPTWQISRSGLDEGYVKITFMAAVQKSNAARYWTTWQWALYPSGGNVNLWADYSNY